MDRRVVEVLVDGVVDPVREREEMTFPESMISHGNKRVNRRARSGACGAHDEYGRSKIAGRWSQATSL
jgi:hypothetical protein